MTVSRVPAITRVDCIANTRQEVASMVLLGLDTSAYATTTALVVSKLDNSNIGYVTIPWPG